MKVTDGSAYAPYTPPRNLGAVQNNGLVIPASIPFSPAINTGNSAIVPGGGVQQVGASQTPGTAPAPSTNPYATPVPDAHILGELNAASKRAYDNALAKIGRSRGDLLREYGYEGDVGNDGTISNLRVSANNPFGLYQQMLRSQALESDSADEGQANRGFSRGSGLIQNLMGQLEFGHQAAGAKLGEDLGRGIADLLEAQRSAKVDYDNDLPQNELTATRSAIDNQQFNPADYSGIPNVAYGDQSVNSDIANPGTGQAPVAGPGKVMWAGRAMNKSQLTTWLRAHNVSPAVWAIRHPAAAKQLGL